MCPITRLAIPGGCVGRLGREGPAGEEEREEDGFQDSRGGFSWRRSFGGLVKVDLDIYCRCCLRVFAAGGLDWTGVVEFLNWGFEVRLSDVR